ncbi:MAG: SWIB/MDM2 domain-containing protein [Gemmatimonadaceae bacterium]
MATRRKGGGRKKAASRKSSRKSSRSTGRKSAKKAGRKSARRKSSGKKRTPNAAFMKPMQPSGELSNVVGSSPMPRTEVTKKLWGYIKRKGLQDSKNRRMINADENLRPIFGRGQVSMFEMTRLVNKHLRNT